MKSAFVTGASGFLGVHLVQELLKQDWNVTAFYMPGDHCQSLWGLDIQMAAGNLLDYESLQKAIPDDEVVLFHLAGDTSMWDKNAERQYQINVVGTRHICKAALEKKVKRVVYTSSSSAYGYHSERINERTVSNALTCKMPYNRTKYFAEIEIQNAIKEGLDAVILNPCNMLGPYDRKGWSTLILSMLDNKASGVTLGVGTFSHVKDVAKAHIKAAERGRTGENYLLGGVAISFKEIFEEINTILGKNIPLKVVAPGMLWAVLQLMKVRSFFDGKEPILTFPRYKRLIGTLLCDDSKARQELDFSTTSIKEMLRDSYEWLKKEHLLGSHHEE